MNSDSKRVTLNLPSEVLEIADAYSKTHGLSRSEVFTLALKLLRQQELAEGYRELAEKQLAAPDVLLDSGVEEILKQTEW